MSNDDRWWFCGLVAAMVDKHLGLPFAEAFPLAPEEERALCGEPSAADGAALLASGSPTPRSLAAGQVAAAALRRVQFADFLRQVRGEAWSAARHGRAELED